MLMRPQILLLALFLFLGVTGCSRQSKINGALAQGKKYQAAGQFEKAKITYLAVLRLDGKNSDAIKQLGYIYWQEGVALEAVRYLLKAKELFPADNQVSEDLASALHALGQVAEARKEAQALLDRSPTHEAALLLLAETASKPEEIDELTGRIEKLPPDETVTLLVRALLLARKGDLAASESAIRQALSKSPNSSQAHAALGTLLAIKKDMAGAEAEFKTASENAAPRSAGILMYPKYLARAGEIKRASEYVEALATKVPDYAPLWLLRAQMAVGEKDAETALKRLDGLFALDPGNFEARILQAQLLLGKGETDKAIDILKKVGESGMYARMPLPKFELARAYLQKGSSTQAVEALNEAIKLHPDYREAILLLAQVKLQQGDPQSAVDVTRALLQKAPNLLPAQLLLSQAYRSQGNLVEAARALQKQIEATPNAPEPHLLLSLVLLQQGKREEARQSFEAVRKISPKNLLAAYHLVEMDLGDKKYEEAMARAKSLIQEIPDSAGPFYVLARVHLAQNDSNAAEAALKKSIEIDPNFTSAYNLLVSIYMKDNRLEQAATQIEAFLARSPENASALLTLGVIQERLMDYEKARTTYQKVIDGNPNATAALNNLAVIYSERLKQFDKAYELASRARTIQPDDAAIADTLGWIAFRRQDYPQAVTLLQESAAKLPQSAEIQYHLGMANYMSGQLDAARAALNKAATAPDEFPGKEEIPQALAMISGGAGDGKEMSNEELEAMLKRQPGDIVVRQRLADRLEKDGAFPKAAALWEDVLKVNPKQLTAMLKLARLNAGPLRDPAKAFDYAKKARALAPNDAEVAKLAGQAALQSGNFGWAYSLLQDAAQQPGADAHVLRDLALTAYSLGKVAEARRAMQRALDLVPNAPEAEKMKQFLDLTALMEKPAEIAAAESRVADLLKDDPENVPGLMLRAALMTQRNQVSDAVQVYQGILARLPDFAPAQKCLAALYLDQPEHADEAFDFATKARRNLPDDPEVAQLLAILRYRRKEYASTLQLLKESSAKQDPDAKSLYYEGMSRLKLKQMTEGYAALSKALESGLEGAPAEEAKKELANQANAQNR